VLRPGGVLVSLGPVLAAAATARGVRARAILVRPEAGHLAEIARLIEVGGVRPAVEAVVPLAAARRAHERSERGRTRGKIVLRVVP
jgi:NADPH:quinone reductase-like Zn-dependent oxidoreductase